MNEPKQYEMGELKTFFEKLLTLKGEMQALSSSNSLISSKYVFDKLDEIIKDETEK